MLKKFLLFCLLFSFTYSYATHNRAGEITYRQDTANPLKYYFTVITYTKVGPNIIADRCDLFLYFGNNNNGCSIFDSVNLPRTNGPLGCNSDFHPSNTVGRGELITPSIKKNIYQGNFTFNGPGNYCLSINDPNRNESIVNIPNSIDVQFYLQSQLTISPFLGLNSSPILLNPPIDDACFCKRYIHNPGAYDPDGDSLSYELINNRDQFGSPIDCYFIPSGATINSFTGDMIWTCPGANTTNCVGSSIGGLGEYNLAILITEWRNGIKIGNVLRDMQINVIGGCQNDPPIIAANDTCVIAGTVMNLAINATDVNSDNIELTSTGLPYLLSSNPASFEQTSNNFGSASAVFNWNTNCSNININPYKVSFKAKDNATNPLVDIKTINITVIAPPPNLVSALPVGTSINLNWLASACPDVVGYKIYRRQGESSFNPSYCETGIPAAAGYEFIKYISGSSTFNFTDNNNGIGLLHGYEYCYRIYAMYSDSSKSKASNEICARLKRDVPIIYKVSVGITSTTNGIDTIEWKKPTEIDPIQWPPPYSYKIYRRESQVGNFAQIATLNNIDQTQFLDTLINTVNYIHYYYIEVYSGENKIGKSNLASSPFLSTQGSDNAITLTWIAEVPWSNNIYYIQKENINNPGEYLLLDSTTSLSYIENGLTNGRTYCYRIITYGNYSDTGFVLPLRNWSQQICGVPEDKTPPCPPKISINADCENILNTIKISDLNRACFDDAIEYRIFYAPQKNNPLDSIATIYQRNDTIYYHNNDSISIAGCYSIAAVDSFGNVSDFSDTVCVDNCPNYELPNVFTPNFDNLNDLLIPFPYKYIKDIDLQIFDRWGALVFKTTDKKILWDGTNQVTKKKCDDGVYYYKCSVNEIRLEPKDPILLKGFIHIMGSNQNQSK